MKSFSRSFGLFFTTTGWITFAIAVVISIIYRFQNPLLTETQLFLWSLEYWYFFLSPLALIGCGYWLLYLGCKTERTRTHGSKPDGTGPMDDRSR